MKKMEIKVKAVCACMAAIAALSGGCGQGEAAEEATAIEKRNAADEAIEAASVKPVKEIYAEIERSVELHSPVQMADSFISNYYGIDPEKLEEYVFAMSEEATSAETVVIMKVKDEADVEKISSALQVVVEEKRGEMENYLPEQFEIVDKSSVKSKGCYVYLVISQSQEAITKIIEEGI